MTEENPVLMDNVKHESGLPFWKYHGTGNDFVMLDNRNGLLTDSIRPDLVRQLCDRHLGVGADGLIVLERAGSGSADEGRDDFWMQYFNSDGSTGALCGNGARCAVAFVLELGIHSSDGHWRFRDRKQRTLEGYLTGSPTAKGVTEIGVRMPDVDRVHVVADASGHFVDTGCPHFVLYVENEAALDRTDVSTSGSALRRDARFRATDGTNVDFACYPADDSEAGVIRVRTFERGVEAETLSCGTGAVAVAVVDLYRKFVSPSKALLKFDNVTSCDDTANPKNLVSDSKRDVIPPGDVTEMCVARARNVTGTGGDATWLVDTDVIAPSSDVSAVGHEKILAHSKNVVCSHLTGKLNAAIGDRQGSYVRYVESRGGRLTVRLDCHKDQTTGRLVFRNILLTGPTTKVFSGRFF